MYSHSHPCGSKGCPEHGYKEGRHSAAAPPHKNTLQHVLTVLDSQAGSGQTGITFTCGHKQGSQPPWHRAVILLPQRTISPLHGLFLKDSEVPKEPVQNSLPLWASNKTHSNLPHLTLNTGSKPPASDSSATDLF